uniref:Uncharacterized protein n=1 Tax=Solanum lycopersicum TaxID=4081 RepID=A0A3Q7HSB0_SOLLC
MRQSLKEAGDIDDNNNNNNNKPKLFGIICSLIDTKIKLGNSFVFIRFLYGNF